MPKQKKKILTATLYTYVRPETAKWVRTQARKSHMPYSLYMDQLITQARRRGIKVQKAA
jgi:hypothetical protein